MNFKNNDLQNYVWLVLLTMNRCKLYKCIRRYTSLPALEPAFSSSYSPIALHSFSAKHLKRFSTSLSLLPHQPFRPWTPWPLSQRCDSRTSGWLLLWLSSHFRTSSSLVLSLRSGDPRILPSCAVCLLSQKHIHPMVSVVIPDISFQWLCSLELGILISTFTKAPQTHDDTTELQIRKHGPPEFLFLTSTTSNLLKNQQLFPLYHLLDLSQPLLLSSTVDLGLFLDLFFLTITIMASGLNFLMSPQSSHPLHTHTHTQTPPIESGWSLICMS